MRKFLFILLIITFKLGYSQVKDSFSDKNFTKNPEWLGKIDLFEINGDFQLQSKYNSQSKFAYLTTLSDYAINTKWEFSINLKFDPSTSNQVRIYLTSNQADLSLPLEGYFVTIGQSGSQDAYQLCKQSGTTITKIIIGALKPRANALEVKAKILVTRDRFGEWILKTAIDDNIDYTVEGKATDLSYTTSTFFGVFCKYTATRSDKFYFDDFAISDLFIDQSPPELLSLNVADKNQIELNFNEILDEKDETKLSNFVLNPGNIIPTIAKIDGSKLTLSFKDEFETNNYTLKVSGLKDVKGNIISEPIITNFYYLKPYLAQLHDIVFNEIFPDPNPQIDLPLAEFIEIWNSSDHDISLNNFTLYNGLNAFTFIGDTIKRNQYIILCAKTDTSLYNQYGKTIGVSPFSILNNKAGNLKLTNQNAQIVDELNYTDLWYNDEVKNDGGFTLELMDAKSKCSKMQVFSASNSPTGGTPGKVNSNNLKNYYNEPLKISNEISVSDSTVTINFNRGIDSLTALNIENYTLNNGLNYPIEVLPNSANYSSLILQFGKELKSNINYTLNISNINDCGNGYIASELISFFKPSKIEKNDILISEILFNPKDDGFDFVEIFNNSDKVLDLNDLYIANKNNKDSTLKSVKIIDRKQLVMPKSYWALTENVANIKENYFTKSPENFISLKNLPSFNNDEGTVILLNKQNHIIDLFSYNEKMHFPLLNTVEGVSLERSNFNTSANDLGNFKSATSSVGYATPTYQNSQLLSNFKTDENVSLVSETFSPDNDGFEDILRIAYNFQNTNWICSITIYDKNGMITKRLIKNQTIGTKGEWHWDGFDENNNKARVGIYLIDISLFNSDGETKKIKKAVVLASKL